MLFRVVTIKEMGLKLVYESVSDNLLLFALNLGALLLLSVVVLFALICRKHWQREKRHREAYEIERLLKCLTDTGLFHQSNQRFYAKLHGFIDHHYLDLLYAFARISRTLSGKDLETYYVNAVRCGLFEQIPHNLISTNPEKICIALEICGLAGLRQHINIIENYSCQPVYAPFACHALVRLNFDEGMASLFRAFGHNVVNNAELLIICSEFDQQKLVAWAFESSHWPLPEVLQKYWIFR